MQADRKQRIAKEYLDQEIFYLKRTIDMAKAKLEGDAPMTKKDGTIVSDLIFNEQNLEALEWALNEITNLKTK